MTRRILFVDDEPAVLSGISRLLHGRFEIATTADPREAVSLLAEQSAFAVLVTDMRMPGMDGLALLREARRVAPQTVRLMLTGNADQETAIDAINTGAIFSFLRKPVAPDALSNALTGALRQHELIVAEKEILERTLAGAVRTLVEVLSAVQPQVFSRALKVRNLAQRIAPRLGLSAWSLDMAAMLSSVGWVALPAEAASRIAREGAHLATGPDRQLADQIPAIGARLLANIPRLHPVSEIVKYQAKNFDGTGLPDDPVAGQQIPAEARLLRLCGDLIDAAGPAPLTATILRAINTRPGLYDPDMALVVDMALGEFADKIANWFGEPVLVRRLADLRAGDVLLDNLTFTDGGLALARHETVTEILKERFLATEDLRPIAMPVHVGRGAAPAAA